MKKLYYLPISLFLVLLAPACDPFLDSVQPVTDLPTGDVYQTAAHLESALNGLYNALQTDNLAGLNLLFIPDVLGHNGEFSEGGLPEFIDFSDLPLRSSNGNVEEFWVESYRAINLANAIINALPNVTGAALPPAVKDRMEGEALLIRAFLHFELLRYFGQPYGDDSPEGGIPLMLDPVLKSDDLSYPARISVDEAYEKVAEDLTKARQLLPVSQGYSRANPRAAVALLARSAFQKEDYATAAALAQSLIEDPSLALAPTPDLVFREKNNPEMIWAVVYSSADRNSSKALWFGASVGYTTITADLATAFASILTAKQRAALQAKGLSAIDMRSEAGVLISPDSLFTNKYEDVAGGTDDTPLARLAEFYLMRAEALARNGEIEDAINLLNEIRSRAIRVVDGDGNVVTAMQDLVLFSPADFPGGAGELIEAIILERRVELCFEGNFFQDMIRLHRDVQGFPFDACELRLPIPQREIDVNSNLLQNGPCY